MTQGAESSRIVLSRGEGQVEILRGGVRGGAPFICAAHPADTFVPGSLELLSAEAPGAEVCGVNPRPTRALEQMVEDLEAVRDELGLATWLFWGMSGGGWLGLLYAHLYPDALSGLVVESACLCFRERLADAACVLSPFFPAWQAPLHDAGLLDAESHRTPSPGTDTEWIELPDVGQVFRRRGGPALLVSPAPVSEAMQRVMPALWEFDARTWARGIRVPTLVMCGTADPIVPVARARAVHEAIAGSRFVAIDGASHVPTAQRHPAVAEALRQFIGR